MIEHDAYYYYQEGSSDKVYGIFQIGQQVITAWGKRSAGKYKTKSERDTGSTFSNHESKRRSRGYVFEHVAPWKDRMRRQIEQEYVTGNGQQPVQQVPAETYYVVVCQGNHGYEKSFDVGVEYISKPIKVSGGKITVIDREAKEVEAPFELFCYKTDSAGRIVVESF